MTCTNCREKEDWAPGSVGICNACLEAYQQDGVKGLEERKYPNGPPEEYSLEEMIEEGWSALDSCEEVGEVEGVIDI